MQSYHLIRARQARILEVELDHIGIAVSSLVESARQYGALGFALSAPEQVPEQGVSVVQATGGTAGKESGHLELLEATGEDSTVARFIQRTGPGLHHVALRVDNLDIAIQRYEAEGFEVIGVPGRGAGGCRCVFLHPRSCGGVLLEILERDI